MRFYRSTHGRTSYSHEDPANFPHFFAVCRGIQPEPQFQILRIERVRGNDEYAHYCLYNERMEEFNESYVIHSGNPEIYYYGQLFLTRRPDMEPQRVHFEIRNVYLASRNATLPILIFDDMSVLPQMNVVVIARNSRNNNNYPSQEPYFIMNYLSDTHNFREINVPLEGPASDFNNYDHRNRSRRNSTWLMQPPPPMRRQANNDSDDESHALEQYWESDAFPYSSIRTPRATTPPPSRQRSTRPAGGSGGGSSGSSSSPAAASAVTLQAFTIEALINHAVAEHMNCPISYNPIRKSTACVTSCQHIFERSSITTWLADHTTCPVCRQATHICN